MNKKVSDKCEFVTADKVLIGCKKVSVETDTLRDRVVEIEYLMIVMKIQKC